MSLVINADGEYLQGTGGTFSPSTMTAASFLIWVKRDNGSSSVQSYAAISPDLSANPNMLLLAHNGTSGDCFIYPANSEKRRDGAGNANSTDWQMLLLTYQQNDRFRVYTGRRGIDSTLLMAETGADVTEAFNEVLDQIRIGLGGSGFATGWYPRAKLAHCAFWADLELSASQAEELFDGGSSGNGKNPTAVGTASLTFYAPLTTDATVHTGGVTLNATGSVTYDTGDNPPVDAAGGGGGATSLPPRRAFFLPILNH